MSLETTRLIELDRRHLIHPHLPLDDLNRTIFVRGKGCQLWDSDGREYLDATGGLWLAQIGHGREEVADVAAKQIRQLEYFTAFWDFSNDQAIQLAARLGEMAPGDLSFVYFTSGGSEGNDAAYKAARYYHHQKGETSRTWILSRKTAYHGLTYGGGTATGFDEDKVGVGPELPHVAHLTPARPYRSWLFNDEDPTEFLIRELEETITRLGAENIAAMVGEPIMGVAGMILPPEEYWPRVQEILEKNGILLILDEVVTAFGRTGHWFAANMFGLRPDIMVTAKGITSGYIPLGAVLMTPEIAHTVTEGPGFPVGYTYSGHPVACAVAMENLDIIEREGLVDRARVMGDYISKQLEEIAVLPVVGEIRHAGLGVAIELVQSKETRRPLPIVDPIADIIRDETGVVARVPSPHTLVLSPPLIISEAQADRAVEAVAQMLTRVRTDGTVK